MPQRKYNVENASLYTAFSRLGRYDFIWLGRFVKSFGWQHHLISVVFFLSQVVCPAQESIQFGRVSPGSVDEREVKPGQEEGSACLLAVQVLGPLEVCEVPMVIQDLYGVFGFLPECVSTLPGLR